MINKQQQQLKWYVLNSTTRLLTQVHNFQSDKDQDGVLNKAEFCSMMNKNKIRNPTTQRGDRMFDELDTNKDGFLDSKELSKALDPSKAYLITKSKRVDKNRDGKLDRKEFRDYMDGSKKKY